MMSKKLKKSLYSFCKVASLRLKAYKTDAAGVPKTGKKVFIGPTNSAGQGFAWARAIEKTNPNVSAVSMQFVHGNEVFQYKSTQTEQIALWAKENVSLRTIAKKVTVEIESACAKK